MYHWFEADDEPYCSVKDINRLANWRWEEVEDESEEEDGLDEDFINWVDD